MAARVEPLLRHDAPAGSWRGQLRLPIALAPTDRPEIASTGALSALAVEVFDPIDAADPLSASLGEVRLLRASPLVPIAARCIE